MNPVALTIIVFMLSVLGLNDLLILFTRGTVLPNYWIVGPVAMAMGVASGLVELWMWKEPEKT